MIASDAASHTPEPVSMPSAAESFKLLIWLKWTLLFRAYAKQKMRMFGTVIMLLVVLPLSVFIAVSCYLFAHGSPSVSAIVCKAMLTVLYAIWLITPVLGFPLNESYDPTRLFTYPVPLRIIFAAGVVGSLFEITTLLAVPLFAVVVLLFSSSVLSAIVALLAVLLFMIHTLATAQLVMLSLIGFLRSRRFRDITMVVFPLIGMTFYFGQQFLYRQMIPDYMVRSILGWSIWRYVAWLPPGWVVSASVAARDGEFAQTLLCLVGLALVAVVPILLAAQVMRSMYFGDRGSAVPAVSEVMSPSRASASRALSAESIASMGRPHQEIRALMQKELIYLVREPQYKALAVNTLYTVLVMFFAFAFNHKVGPMSHNHIWQRGGMDSLFQGLHIIISSIIPTGLLLATLPLTFNIFGGDASAITVLLSFPTPRKKLFIAKNLAHAQVVVCLCLVGIVVSAFLLHQTDLLLMEVAWVLLATPVVIGAGNLVSVRFPHKLIVRGQRWGKGGQVSFGSGPTGCGYAFLYFACFLGALALIVPVAAAVIAPVALGATSVLFITIPLALVYSVLVYGVATTFAASLLERRESEMISMLAPDD